MKTVYNKLVRDRIPEIIEAGGKTAQCRILSETEYLDYLDQKLQEEMNEYLQDQSLEELADLLEVIRAVIKARGSSYEAVETIRMDKAEKRGAFEQKILLVETRDE